MSLPTESTEDRLDFVRQIVADDTASGSYAGRVVTRFPPEPNGYLHIGHAKSLCLNFGIPLEFADQVAASGGGGEARCHMRFDDTNPTKEEDHYVNAIMKDVQWMGFDWGDHLYFASDNFQQLYDWAVKLIKDGKAYVDDQTPDEIREGRGNLTTPGTESPYRDRPIAESLDLFERMKAGEFPDGSRVLRAKIDMASGNINMRDPVMYRILHAEHHRTGDTWCIYPTYDFTHGQSDAIENVSHSICTLEFEDHRPLYDWYLQALGFEGPPRKPRQIEFAKLNVSYTMLSKRNLLKLVEENHVEGWDDPRMPTLSGMRRRGFTPEAIRNFCKTIGIAKRENVIEIELLEHCLREDLNKRALRRSAVLDPLKVVLTNWPEGHVEMRQAQNNPEDPDAGYRDVPMSRELYIERSDFMEDPPKKFFRLGPSREVRLRFGYFIRCDEVVKNDAGEIVELRCTYDPETSGGQAPDGRKVKGTIHWVSAEHAVDAEVRLYDKLFAKEDPYDAEDGDWRTNLNPDSLAVVTGAKLEPALADAKPGEFYQFERTGYFTPDSQHPHVFNRTVGLKDTWAKMQKKS